MFCFPWGPAVVVASSIASMSLHAVFVLTAVYVKGVSAVAKVSVLPPPPLLLLSFLCCWRPLMFQLSLVCFGLSVDVFLPPLFQPWSLRYGWSRSLLLLPSLLLLRFVSLWLLAPLLLLPPCCCWLPSSCWCTFTYWSINLGKVSD